MLDEYFYKVYELYETEQDILTFIEEFDENNSVLEIEDLLISKSIPFNRVNVDLGLERKFRPSREDMNAIDVEVHSVDGHTVIRTDVIRKLLQESISSEMTLQKIERALSEIDPEVSSLREWAKMDIPVISTAEIEDARFSDIL